MRKFFSFLLFTLIIGIVISLLITQRYEETYPKQVGPEFDAFVRYNHQDYLNENMPDMVLLGDSTLKDSVDFEELSEILEMDVYGVAIPGSTTALWYLILKNNIITADHKPDYLVIFYRETLMTTSDYRVDGNYFATIDEYAFEKEPLLLELSYLQKYTATERWALSWLPLYGERMRFRESIDYRIQNSLPGWTGCRVGCVEQAHIDVFEGAIDDSAIQEFQELSENYLWRIDKLLFARQVKRSFLPEMVRMAHLNDIQLILVEMKTYRSQPSVITAFLLEKYQQDLVTYCEENDIKMISFADDPRLVREWFPDGFHLKDDKKTEFTDMFADELSRIFD